MGIFTGTRRQKVIVVSGHKPSFIRAHPMAAFWIAVVILCVFVWVTN
jgi:hypothetical protein